MFSSLVFLQQICSLADGFFQTFSYAQKGVSAARIETKNDIPLLFPFCSLSLELMFIFLAGGEFNLNRAVFMTNDGLK